MDIEDHRQTEDLRTQLQGHIDETYPELNAKVWQFVLGPVGGSKIEARFFATDAVVLRDLVGQAKTIMSDAAAVANIDDWREQVQVVRPIVDSETARRLGLTQGEVYNVIYSHLIGTNLSVYRERDELLNIVMRPVDAARNDIGELRNIQVCSADAPIG